MATFPSRTPMLAPRFRDKGGQLMSLAAVDTGVAAWQNGGP